jgi:uncharacterized membrane protein
MTHHGSNERRGRRRTATGRAKQALKARYASKRSRVEVIADRLAKVGSSAGFLAFHVVWFAVWIGWNVGLVGAKPFDPFPFGLLTMVVSLEAIFLSILVLLVQSREAQIAELREEISLQVILRMEEEVTKTLQLVAGLYTRSGHQLSEDAELQEMLKPLDEKQIEDDLMRQIETAYARG